MSLDLIMLPQYEQLADFSIDLLRLNRDEQLFDIIRDIETKKGREVQRKGIHSFVGDTYSKTTETAYGDILKGVLAGELKEVLSDYKTESWKNKAVIAYINELPDDLEIWLYWC